MKRCSKCGEEKPVEAFGRHVRKRDGLDSCCKACRAEIRAANREAERERKAVYRAANREALQAKNAAYRAANKDAMQAKNAAYYAANKDAMQAYRAAYYAANREAERERKAAYRAANKDATQAKSAAYYAANKDAMQAYRAANRDARRANDAAYRATHDGKAAGRAGCQRRRARKLAAECDPHVRLSDVIGLWGAECYICGVETDPDAPPRAANKAELEHVTPLSRGGTHTLRNLRVACRRCNRVKGAHRTPEQVRQMVCVDVSTTNTGVSA